MSILIAVVVVSGVALLAALPGDWARRGGSGAAIGFGSAANLALPGLAFWAGSQTGLIHGLAGFIAVGGSILAGNVLADRLASRRWGPVRRP